MKYFFLFLLSILLVSTVQATGKDSTVYYTLPDSIKAVQSLAEITVKSVTTGKEVFAGIKTDAVKLSLESDKNERTIVFEFPKTANVMAAGLNTDVREKGEIEWKYNWKENETYKLLIAMASDSAGNFSLYTGYIFLPKENKWKLIGSCKIAGRWNTIQTLASFNTKPKKGNLQTHIGEVWCQRRNGSWKNMKNETLPNPTINLFGHIDSIAQRVADQTLIIKTTISSKTDSYNIKDDVYYTMIKEGTGRQVSVNDTVTVNYRLNLLNDTTVINQTNDKPATFPLKGLIRGWQIGVPLCKVGGKIKLILPSDLAYSIRTRSPNIPPNSILEFEIEVLDAKSPQ